jgi:hypothetical protein
MSSIYLAFQAMDIDQVILTAVSVQVRHFIQTAQNFLVVR